MLPGSNFGCRLLHPTRMLQLHWHVTPWLASHQVLLHATHLIATLETHTRH